MKMMSGMNLPAFRKADFFVTLHRIGIAHTCNIIRNRAFHAFIPHDLPVLDRHLVGLVAELIAKNLYQILRLSFLDLRLAACIYIPVQK